MWRHIASNTLTFLIVSLFLIAGVITWGTQQYSSAGPLETAICFQVDRGTNMRRVSEKLADQGAITSPAIFRMGVDYAEKSGDLKAGSFLVPEAASMEEIVDTITASGVSTCGTEVVYRVGVTRASVQVRELDPQTNRFVEVAAFNPAEEEPSEAYLRVRQEQDTRYRVALAEGVTSWQIVNSLNGLDVLDGVVETVPPEGALAPDSYEFTPGDDPNEIVVEMLRRQERVLANAWENRAPELPLNSPEEALILASIVEKETGLADERPQVASVFVNRLNRGMRLQTDPTVIYGITRGEGVLGRGLRQSELRRRTPWNTYVIDGLPPTTIAAQSA